MHNRHVTTCTHANPGSRSADTQSTGQAVHIDIVFGGHPDCSGGTRITHIGIPDTGNGSVLSDGGRHTAGHTHGASA